MWSNWKKMIFAKASILEMLKHPPLIRKKKDVITKISLKQDLVKVNLPFVFIIFSSVLFCAVLYSLPFSSLPFSSLLFSSLQFSSILFSSGLFYCIVLYSVLFYSILLQIANLTNYTPWIFSLSIGREPETWPAANNCLQEIVCSWVGVNVIAANNILPMRNYDQAVVWKMIDYFPKL